MNTLISWTKIKEAILGAELRKTVLRNAQAADKLDRAVKEMLGK